MPTFDSDEVSKIHQHLHSHLPSDSALRVKALETEPLGSQVHEKSSHSIIIKDHEVIIRIATKPDQRMDCYRELFRVGLDDQIV